MKAEQRKELETNALADRMGHLMQRVKTQPRRNSLYWVVGALTVVIVSFLVIRWFQVSRTENSLRWQQLDQQSLQGLSELIKNHGDSNPGKAARFQYAWLLFWEAGVKRLGVGNGVEGMERMEEAAGLYKKLAEECTDDEVWGPEALYGLAVIEETHAIMTIDALDSAKKLYENLAKQHPKTARGKLAEQWVADYDNAEKRNELRQFYQELHTSLNIPDLNALRRQLEQKQPLFPPKDGKDGKAKPK